MKNILIIMGTGRKNGNTKKLVDLFISNFNKNKYNIEFLYLSDYKIEFCKGCTICFKHSESSCPLKDDLSLITDKIKSCDGLIFTSPIYGADISGQLKTFIDRISYLYHRPSLIAKPAVFLTTTDIGYIKKTSKYMKHIIVTLGMRFVGSAGSLSVKLSKDANYKNSIVKNLKNLAINFEKELNRKDLPTPTFKQLLLFTAWKTRYTLYTDMYQYDAQYWKEKGWLESDYFYDTNVSVFKKFALKIISIILPKVLNKKIPLD